MSDSLLSTLAAVAAVIGLLAVVLGVVLHLTRRGTASRTASGERYIIGRRLDAVTQAERTNRLNTEASQHRLSLLLEVGKELADPDDRADALSRVAQLLAPAVVDWCTIDLVEPDGTTRRLASARAQEAIDAPRREQTIARPLVARGRTLGTLSFGKSEASGPLGTEDLTLLEEIAARLALVLDNLRLSQEAQDALARYRGVLEGSLDALLLIDAQGRYVDANRPASEMLGFSRDEIIQMKIGDLPAAGPPWTEAERSQFVRRGYWQGDMAISRRDKPPQPVEVRVTAVVVADETMYLTVLRPLFNRRALERIQEHLIAMVVRELKGLPMLHRAFVQVIQRCGTVDRLIDSDANAPMPAGQSPTPMLTPSPKQDDVAAGRVEPLGIARKPDGGPGFDERPDDQPVQPSSGPATVRAHSEGAQQVALPNEVLASEPANVTAEAHAAETALDERSEHAPDRDQDSVFTVISTLVILSLACAAIILFPSWQSAATPSGSAPDLSVPTPDPTRVVPVVPGASPRPSPLPTASLLPVETSTPVGAAAKNRSPKAAECCLCTNRSRMAAFGDRSLALLTTGASPIVCHPFAALSMTDWSSHVISDIRRHRLPTLRMTGESSG